MSCQHTFRSPVLSGSCSDKPCISGTCGNTKDGRHICCPPGTLPAFTVLNSVGLGKEGDSYTSSVALAGIKNYSLVCCPKACTLNALNFNNIGEFGLIDAEGNPVFTSDDLFCCPGCTQNAQKEYLCCPLLNSLPDEDGSACVTEDGFCCQTLCCEGVCCPPDHICYHGKCTNVGPIKGMFQDLKVYLDQVEPLLTMKNYLFILFGVTGLLLALVLYKQLKH